MRSAVAIQLGWAAVAANPPPMTSTSVARTPARAAPASVHSSATDGHPCSARAPVGVVLERETQVAQKMFVGRIRGHGFLLGAARPGSCHRARRRGEPGPSPSDRRARTRCACTCGRRRRTPNRARRTRARRSRRSPRRDHGRDAGTSGAHSAPGRRARATRRSPRRRSRPARPARSRPGRSPRPLQCSSTTACTTRAHSSRSAPPATARPRT